MIDVLDYGLGNLGSVLRMIAKVGGEARRISSADEIRNARKLIIPGVGHFDRGMGQIEERGLFEPLRNQVTVERVPVLGICLGMQLLCLSSEEGVKPGLAFVDASVKRFVLPPEAGLRIPHMGWRPVNVARPNPILDESTGAQRFYFVHSYHVVPNAPELTIATAAYGIDFCAAFQSENIFGVQFHPEKSHRFGMTLMRKFVEFR